jgi:hypothetical protein
MTIKEKIACSSDVTRFTLFKEGLFYKCYNEDAMVFVNKVKPYKVSAKFVKNMGENVYSIGFPVREKDKNGTGIDFETISEKLLASHYEAKDKSVVFYLEDRFIKDDYAGWINNIQSIAKLCVSEEPTAVYQKKTVDILTGIAASRIEIVAGGVNTFFPTQNKTGLDLARKVEIEIIK